MGFLNLFKCKRRTRSKVNDTAHSSSPPLQEGYVSQDQLNEPDGWPSSNAGLNRIAHNQRTDLEASSHAVLATHLVGSPTLRTGGGLFQNAQSFEVHGGKFTDASQTRIKNVYNGVNGGSTTAGLDILSQYMSPSALHNSADRFDAPKCDEDTRTGVIEEIMNWIQDPSAPTHILCMTGPAGTGKSALEQTIAEKCTELGILAASFFFSVSDTSRNSKTPLISTIAYQLAQSIKDARDFIAAAAADDRSIFKKTLDAQIDALLVQPLRKAAEQRGGREHWPHVIVIDGLDECSGVEHQSHILSALCNSFIKHDSHFRILIASRPEYAIRTALKGHLHDAAYRIELDDKYNPGNDIKLYLQRRLADVGRIAEVEGVANGMWPSPDDVEALVTNASGQFIYAATVVKFVSQRQFSPVQRLQLLLTWSPDQTRPRNPFAALDTLYTSILSLAQDALKDETDDPLSIVRLLNRLRALDPELRDGDDHCISFLEKFPFLSPGEIQGTLSDLHALVKLADDEITYHHKSFIDFLESPLRSGKYYIDMQTIHTELVLIFAKCISPTPTPGMFTFHPALGTIPSSYLWWDIVHESSQDNSVIGALEQFNFKEWVTLVELEEDPFDLSGITKRSLRKVIDDINKNHTSSPRWLKLRAQMTVAEEALDGIRRLANDRR